ncbi:MAG: 3-deoxy-8-phosphooctulonate synthase, partial [Betaproteobacteria bacterium AqS2]|nr:3-deoxy-8-phosphooctulonate synthase [Betaproteobacteria bacterium AqS2]
MRVAGPVAVGGVRIGAGEPLAVIGGPCAAESPQLCLEAGAALRDACKAAGVGYVFKASFDKANRTSGSSGRGPGMDEGLAAIARAKEELGVPAITDIHLPGQAAAAAAVCDALQIPAFLCRQTDLLAAAAATGLPVLVKKGQFLAPWDMSEVAAKLEAAGAAGVLLCERGTMFGYRNLVVDMRALAIMRETGWPVVFDATHSTQLPGAAEGASGGEREMAPVLARAAAAVGIDALFLEAHPRPAEAVSDAAVQLPLPQAAAAIASVARIA